jgi:hypothetical protein
MRGERKRSDDKAGLHSWSHIVRIIQKQCIPGIFVCLQKWQAILLSMGIVTCLLARPHGTRNQRGGSRERRGSSSFDYFRPSNRLYSCEKKKEERRKKTSPCATHGSISLLWLSFKRNSFHSYLWDGDVSTTFFWWPDDSSDADWHRLIWCEPCRGRFLFLFCPCEESDGTNWEGWNWTNPILLFAGRKSEPLLSLL